MADWAGLARRPELLHADLMDATGDAPDLDESQLIQLEAISIRHIAHPFRYLGDLSAQPRSDPGADKS